MRLQCVIANQQSQLNNNKTETSNLATKHWFAMSPWSSANLTDASSMAVSWGTIKRVRVLMPPLTGLQLKETNQ